MVRNAPNFIKKYLCVPASALILIAGLAGCSAKKQEPVFLSLPYPPHEPKIAYVDSYTGEKDFASKSAFSKMLGDATEKPLVRPNGVVVFQERIFATQLGVAEIMIIDPVKRKISYISDTEKFVLRLPGGIAADADGNIYVTDMKGKQVVVFNQDGVALTAISGDFVNPVGIGINNTLKRIYVADSKAHKVLVFALSGEKLFEFGKRGSEAGEFNYPVALTLDKKNGDIYVVDSQNQRIQVFNQEGTFIRKFGSAGDAVGFFSQPRAIALDSEGQVYVVDARLNNFQVLDNTGLVSGARYGTGGENPGQFRDPSAIFIDDKDRIYIVDSLNGRIAVYQSMNEAWKKDHPEEYEKHLQERAALVKAVDDARNKSKKPGGK